MTNDSPGNQLPSSSPCRWHGWAPLAITSVLSVVLVVIILSRREHQSPDASTPPDEPKPVRVRALPLPPGVASPSDAMSPPLQTMTPLLHSVVLEEREGAQVLHIRARAEGDELIVDPATGRLMGVRDAKGKTIPWPVSPANATELPLKNS